MLFEQLCTRVDLLLQPGQRSSSGHLSPPCRHFHQGAANWADHLLQTVGDLLRRAASASLPPAVASRAARAAAASMISGIERGLRPRICAQLRLAGGGELGEVVDAGGDQAPGAGGAESLELHQRFTALLSMAFS